MKSAIKEADRILTGHLLSPNEVFIRGTDLHHLELQAKDVLENHQTTQAVAKSIDRSSPSGQQGPLLKTTSPQLTEHGDVKLVST